MTEERKCAAKEAYATPRLAVYGDIGSITATMAISGADGGTQRGMTYSR